MLDTVEDWIHGLLELILADCLVAPLFINSVIDPELIVPRIKRPEGVRVVTLRRRRLRLQTTFAKQIGPAASLGVCQLI